MGFICATAVISAGCSRKKDKPEVTGVAATVDATNSSIVVDAGPVAADGSNANVTITLMDSANAPVAGVVPQFAVDPSTGATAGTCPATDASGVSVCTLSSSVAETKAVAISFPVQKAGNSVVFQAGAAAKLCFNTQPGGGAAGVAWAQQPVVRIGDVNCNLVSSASNNVTMVLAGSLGTLNGTATVAASSGVATFSGLNINQSGTKVLSATASGLTSADSGSFVITGGAPTSLVFATQPGGGATGVVWAQQPVVNLMDTYGNVAASSATVLLTLETGSGTLAGAVSRNANSGVVNYSGLSMATIGSKTIRATSIVPAGTITVVSNSFAITPGAPAKLAFSVQPGGGSIGVAWSQQPVVQVLDAQDNVIPTATDSVTLTLIQGSGNLNGTSTVSASSGLATFSGLSIDQAGNDKVLRASSGSLAMATSATFGISAAPQLCWQNSPTNSAAGSAFPSQPVLFVSDNFCGTAMTSATGTVSLSVGVGSGLVLGTTAVSVVSGVSTFNGLSMQVSGNGKRLLGQYSGPVGAMGGTLSTAFDVYAGPAANLVFARQPSATGTAAIALAVQPVVQAVDVYGNALTSSTTISIALANGTIGGTLTGAGTTVTSSGSISYAGLAIDKSGVKNLRVTLQPGTVFVDSDAITIGVGAASRLSFSTQPGGGTAGVNWLQQPVVQVLDAGGNIVTSSSAPVALSIIGTGVLSGSGSIAASAGVATYSGLSIDLIGTGKQLVAASAGLTSGTSSVFNIVQGPATRLCWLAQPGTGTAGVAFATQPRVIVADSGCNVVNGASNSVTLLVSGGGALLGGGTVAAASMGTASFSGLNMTVSGVKSLNATAAGLTSAGTISFTINSNVPSQLAFATQPGNGTAAVVLAQQPVVEVRDVYSNIVTSGTGAVSLSLSMGTGSFSGTGTVGAVAGVATFSGLSFLQSGIKQLSAAYGTLSVASGTFGISPGGATQLAFTTQPGGGTAGVNWLQQPVVVVRDASGNTVTAGSFAISLAVTAGTGSLFGTTSRFSSSGVATYTGLSMQAAGSNKVITATSPGLSSAASSPVFVIVPNISSATVSTVAANPTTIFAGAGTTANSLITATIMDAYSNPISGRSVNIMSSRGTTDIFIGGTTGTSNASGVVTYSVYSPVVGVGTMTASVPLDSVTVTQKPVITFESYVMNVANSSWSIAPVTVAADNSDTAAVNVILRNNVGTVLPNKSVTLVSSRGATDTIATSPATTNGSGAVTYTVRSATRGEPTFTIASAGDSLNLTTSGKILFYDVAPIADWQAQLANSSAAAMGPGLNSPATTVWKDLFNLGPNDGTLNNVGTIATSGWCGSGTGTVATCATGAYRLVLDGTNDYVNFGTGVNSSANRTHEAWIRTVVPADRGELIMSNGDTSNRGLTIRQAWDASGKLELTAGESRSYPGEVWADTPIGYYRFNEPAGSTTGTANIGTNGTITSMGTIGSPTGIQDPGTAYHFNGTASFLNMGNVYPPTNNMTISAMIYPTSVAGTDTIASKGSSATQGYSLELNAGRIQMRSRDGTSNKTVTGTTVLSTNTWYHVAGVRDSSGTIMKVFVNGVQEGSVAIAAAASTSTNNFNIGRLQTGANYFQGRIDELAIYSTALSNVRIAAQAAARNQHTCYTTAAVPANAWRHVAATFNDTSKDMSLYLNGVLQCTRSATGYSVGSSTFPLAIGAEVDAGNTPTAPYFNGMFGDIRVYDQALSGPQILNNFNATTSRFP